ncbi:hypothetical protein CHUAL_004688 [Chamberlinius hualienensis]
MVGDPIEILFNTPPPFVPDHNIWNVIQRIFSPLSMTTFNKIPHKFQILLHDSSIDVTYKVFTKGIQLPPLHFAALVYNKQMKLRAQPCLTIEMENTCHSSCMDTELLENATCRMPFMKTLDLPLCHKLKTINKLYPVPIHHFQKPIDIKCTCKSACNTTSYDVYVDIQSPTGTKYPNTTHISVYRSSTRPFYLVTSERRNYSFNNLLCDIGGTLGLFVGISILTMCEIIEYALLCATDWMKRFKTISKLLKNNISKVTLKV